MGFELSAREVAELRVVGAGADSAAVRARIVLWAAEGKRRKEVGRLAGVSLPTVDRWIDRYAAYGLAGLAGRRPGGGREQVPSRARARVMALTRSAPPPGMARWSSRALAEYLARTEGISVSWNYVARVWREEKVMQSGSQFPDNGPEIDRIGARSDDPWW